MASLLLKGDSYSCQFYYLGRRFTVTIGEVGKDEAEDFTGSVGQILRCIKQKLLHVPPGVVITDFVIAGGQVTPVEEAATPPEPTSFAALRNADEITPVPNKKIVRGGHGGCYAQHPARCSV
ncbi:MAG: hypothetical protein L0Z62_03830, partial [Gemmataceae bacterium]|nr:hypothetical protein [Gemmataceae bacterium]